MKHNLLLFILLVSSIWSSAQCPNNPWSMPLIHHSSDFENGLSHVRYKIDSSFTNNIWQIGSVNKSGFKPALSPSNVLQTDSLNYYPVNNISSIEFWNDSAFTTMGFNKLASFSFCHYYDVDSLTDSLMVQLTLDSGKHWYGPQEFKDSFQLLGLIPMMSFEGIRNDNLHPYNSQKIFFTGSDTNWTQVSVCFTFLAINPPRQLDSSDFGVRFLFISDSIQNNKPGWEIDNFEFISPGVIGAIKELNQTEVKVYPNPSYSGEFRFELPDSFHPSKIEVYDMFGRLVTFSSNSNIISLAEFANGLYSFKLQCKESPQLLGGKLMKY